MKRTLSIVLAALAGTTVFAWLVHAVLALVGVVNGEMAPLRAARGLSTEARDMFESDLHSATVVTLFLREDFNLHLRPKLVKELKPGSRIVSNTFDRYDGKPVSKLRSAIQMLTCLAANSFCQSGVAVNFHSRRRSVRNLARTIVNPWMRMSLSII